MKRYAVTSLNIFAILYICNYIPGSQMNSYLDWAIYAVKVTLVSTLTTLALNFLLYRKELCQMMQKVANILKRVIKK